jgi:quinol monooxygenase YgiN
MSTIRPGNTICTLINVFTVASDNQQRLIDILDQATARVMQHLPGFISANIHRSLDGTRVTNYAQWASRDAFEAMLRHPEAQKHMAEATRIANAEPHLYEVVTIYEAAAQ